MSKIKINVLALAAITLTTQTGTVMAASDTMNITDKPVKIEKKYDRQEEVLKKQLRESIKESVNKYNTLKSFEMLDDEVIDTTMDHSPKSEPIKEDHEVERYIEIYRKYYKQGPDGRLEEVSLSTSNIEFEPGETHNISLKPEPMYKGLGFKLKDASFETDTGNREININSGDTFKLLTENMSSYRIYLNFVKEYEGELPDKSTEPVIPNQDNKESKTKIGKVEVINPDGTVKTKDNNKKITDKEYDKLAKEIAKRNNAKLQEKDKKNKKTSNKKEKENRVFIYGNDKIDLNKKGIQKFMSVSFYHTGNNDYTKKQLNLIIAIQNILNTRVNNLSDEDITLLGEKLKESSQMLRSNTRMDEEIVKYTNAFNVARIAISTGQYKSKTVATDSKSIKNIHKNSKDTGMTVTRKEMKKARDTISNKDAQEIVSELKSDVKENGIKQHKEEILDVLSDIKDENGKSYVGEIMDKYEMTPDMYENMSEEDEDALGAMVGMFLMFMLLQAMSESAS